MPAASTARYEQASRQLRVVGDARDRPDHAASYRCYFFVGQFTYMRRRIRLHMNLSLFIAELCRRDGRVSGRDFATSRVVPVKVTKDEFLSSREREYS